VPDNSKFCPFGTYILNLEHSSEDALFANLHPKRRNTIRNAEKNNVAVKWDHTPADFYQLYKATMKRSNMFCEPFVYFKELVAHLGSEHILCGVSYYENKPQAAVFIPYSNYGGYYMHGATNDTIEQPGAMDYLQWEVIKKLKNNGAKRYDFVGARLSDVTGTKLEGIQNFKKRFGGELMQGYLWKKDIDTLQCKLFDTLLSLNQVLKSKKRLKDIIDEESGKTAANA
jgi:lipid II:glycine glycyltransferase (peptidoglycan interpeptide bridge formation enzyme)